MSIAFRRATEIDAPAIASLKQIVWPQEDPVDLVHPVNALRASDHATYVAVDNDVIIGFASGFPTRSGTGNLRWEVDLLAVHPHYRGQQIGVKLVQLSTQVGADRGWTAQGAVLARGLVASDNIA